MTDNHRQFWEDRWQAAVTDAPMRRDSNNAMQRWNKMAYDFAERTSDKDNCDKRQKTITWLQELGALQKGATVLDIGAGPGNWALPLAGLGTFVTALEPAEVMINILQSRIRTEETSSIAIRRATWQEIDLDREGWRGAFDLVFASMTPGIDGPVMLKKMMTASKGFCYVSSFAGRHWQDWYGELWRELFNDELNGHGNDIIYPFNLVYAMGYRPELRFDHWDRTIAWTRDKAIEDFTAHLESYTELTGEIHAAIASHVDARSVDGVFSQTRSGYLGMMAWDGRNRIHTGDEGEGAQ